MKTKSIEERAAERYDNPQEPYCFETDREQQWYRCGECDGYIAGATEQDRIARQEEREWCVQKAQDAHCQLCSFLCDGVCALSDILPPSNCEEREQIRKAIEEGSK